MGESLHGLGKDVAMVDRKCMMNRKLKLLSDIKHGTYAIRTGTKRSAEEVNADCRTLEFIRTWVDELETHEQAMIEALAPYLPEGE
jgi:hypothetical protein